jgi:hypothetical protein
MNFILLVILLLVTFRSLYAYEITIIKINNEQINEQFVGLSATFGTKITTEIKTIHLSTLTNQYQYGCQQSLPDIVNNYVLVHRSPIETKNITDACPFMTKAFNIQANGGAGMILINVTNLQTNIR